MNYFPGLDPFIKTLWFIAIPATVIVIIRIFLSILGKDGTENTVIDPTLSAEDSRVGALFTFRNVINFLLGFSWGGLLLSRYIGSTLLLIITAFPAGILVVVFCLAIRKKL